MLQSSQLIKSLLKNIIIELTKLFILLQSGIPANLVFFLAWQSTIFYDKLIETPSLSQNKYEIVLLVFL